MTGGSLSRRRLVLGLLVGSVGTGALYVLWKRRRQRFLKWLKEGPRAKKKPHKVPFGNVEGRNNGTNPAELMDPCVEHDDDYFWLRDDTRKSREVLSYIKEENSYTNHKTRHLKKLRKEVYEDMLSHLKQTDQEYPYPWGGYIYYSRTVEKLSYHIFCRRAAAQPDAPEEVILDVNKLAKSGNHKYMDVGSWEPSPDHSLLGYSVDTTGYETYDIYFKDLRSGKLLDDRIKDVAGGLVWGADNSVVYYETMDSEHRPHKLWRHELGTPTEQDVLLFTEDDQRFWMGASKCDSGRFIVVHTGGKMRDETHIIDLQGAVGAAAHASRELRVVEARREEGSAMDHRYSVEHHGEHLYILTNKDGALNSKLVKTPVDKLGAANWVDVFPYDPLVKMDYIKVFRDFLVIVGRQHGFVQIWVYEPSTGVRYAIEQPEPVLSAWGSHNCVFETDVFRFEYSSPVTPRCTIDFNLKTRERKLLKQTEVPKYDPSLYACQRLSAPAPDGTQVPVSLVYRKSTYPEGKPVAPVPFLLYGYGSYGACIDPNFDGNRIALLDRGVAFAIAHIRGGGEMGRQWYEKEGKFLSKRNTFTDFIAVAEHLIKHGYTTNDQLAIWGASAGGLLIGAVVNMRPDLFRAAVADVPFVDVMCTMSDASIPLTVTEWEEWGNPNERRYYEYMRSYSPLDNIKRQPYPAMLVTGGLSDPRVSFWEPTKLVAKLREYKTDDRLLLLKIDLSAGHFSASDRYKYLEERAFAYAFLLEQLGVAQ